MSGGNVERRGYTGTSGRAKARERQSRDNKSRMDSIAAKTAQILALRELAKDREAIETSKKQIKRSPGNS